MVNYCCVKNCDRNSKSSNHLTFYSLPKERHRYSDERLTKFYNYFVEQWLESEGIITKWCCYKKRHRTTNLVEAWNQRIQIYLGRQPSLLSFLEMIEVDIGTYDTAQESQEEWLKAGCRDDLLAKANLKPTYRFCSRHFAPSSIKNRNLCPDAVPTICLPGSKEDGKHQDDTPLVVHDDVVCNNCKNPILGFRYKCVNCADYDLCPKCEMQEAHSFHYMLRIPKPLKSKVADDLIKKWQDFFKAEHVKPNCTYDSDDSNNSSDDEPITKYVKHYDSGIDLSEDVKDTIRNEITRVLNLKENNKQTERLSKKRVSATKRSADDIEAPNLQSLLNKAAKKPKAVQPDNCYPIIDRVQSLCLPEVATHVQSTPGVAFADVNQLGDQSEMKFEVPVLQTFNETQFVQPLMHVKLSDDLSELMIEMTQNGTKTVYKYGD